MQQTPQYSDSNELKLVLGTAGLGGAWGNIDSTESIETILLALENGITRLDTAPAYAKAEEIVGEALRAWNGKAPFVSTKVGKLEGNALDDHLNNYALDVMEKSVKQSLEKLGRTTLDLLFLHEPEKVPLPQVDEVAGFMIQLKQKGIAQAIGFGGTPPRDYYPYIEAGLFDVVMGYNNLDAVNLEAIHTEIPFFKSHNLTTYQGSALHMGLLGNRFEQYQKEKPGWLSEKELATALKVRETATSNNMDLATLAHRYVLSIREIDYVVIGPRKRKHLVKTLADCRQGILPREIFCEITNHIVS